MPFDILTKFGKETPKVEIPSQTAKVETNVCDTLSCVINKRRSVRKYQNKPVPDNAIKWIFEAARQAPSAGNYQPWEFIIVKDEQAKKDIVAACYNQNWMLEAPVFIVACVNMRLASAVYGERGGRLYGIQAVGAAIENILLMAQAIELGTCWVGAFAEIPVSRLTECPEYVRPCAIITLGYPAEEPKAPPKQNMGEFVHIEKFGDTMQQLSVNEEKKPTYMKFQ